MRPHLLLCYDWLAVHLQRLYDIWAASEVLPCICCDGLNRCLVLGEVLQAGIVLPAPWQVLPLHCHDGMQPVAGHGCNATYAQARERSAFVNGYRHLDQHPKLSACRAGSCRQWVGRAATLAGDRAAEVRRAATAALEVVYRAMDGPTLLAHIAAASPTEQASPALQSVYVLPMQQGNINVHPCHVC